MKKTTMKGQEAIEFIVITTLIFFGALFTIFAFGDKIATFFTTDSSVAKASTNTNTAINPANESQFKPDYETSIPNEHIVIGDYDATINEDKSVSFIVDGQPVNLSRELFVLAQDVLKTSGAEGMNDFLREAIILVKEAKNIKGESVPIELIYGDLSESQADSPVAQYYGTVGQPSYAIKCGSHVVVIQKDTNCIGNTCTNDSFFKIVGQVDENNSFNGTVLNSKQESLGTISSSADFSNGLNLYNGTFEPENQSQSSPWCIDLQAS